MLRDKGEKGGSSVRESGGTGGGNVCGETVDNTDSTWNIICVCSMNTSGGGRSGSCYRYI